MLKTIKELFKIVADFLILGGDLRQVFLAKELTNLGYKVNTYGLGNENDDIIETIIKNSKNIIFPIPVTKNQTDLYASLCKTHISLKFLKENLKNVKSTFFLPGINKNEKEILGIGKNVKTYHYCTEELLVKNAQLTAQATKKIIEKYIGKNYKNKNTLICGFGRLGKELSRILKNDITKLTISARKKEDFIKIKRIKLKYIHTNNIKEHTDFEVIINTIPAKIFTKDSIQKISKKIKLFIDLASNPGGIETEAIHEIKGTHIHALGLPGKIFPESAGKILATEIIKLYEVK